MKDDPLELSDNFLDLYSKALAEVMKGNYSTGERLYFNASSIAEKVLEAELKIEDTLRMLNHTPQGYVFIASVQSNIGLLYSLWYNMSLLKDLSEICYDDEKELMEAVFFGHNGKFVLEDISLTDPLYSTRREYLINEITKNMENSISYYQKTIDALEESRTYNEKAHNLLDNLDYISLTTISNYAQVCDYLGICESDEMSNLLATGIGYCRDIFARNHLNYNIQGIDFLKISTNLIRMYDKLNIYDTTGEKGQTDFVTMKALSYANISEHIPESMKYPLTIMLKGISSKYN